MGEHAEECGDDVAGRLDVIDRDPPSEAVGIEVRGRGFEIRCQIVGCIAEEIALIDLSQSLTHRGGDAEIHLGDERPDGTGEG